uniref:Guanylate cyclase domain-containing protein n=1 Tax=Peronospora matthiolae TaxID=2874970 RepID=A0AAV1TSQ3_9STRA
MIWAFFCVTALALSTAGTGLILFKFCKDWEGRASCVRWLLAAFFICQFITASARLAYFIWLTIAINKGSHSGDYEDMQEQAVVTTELYDMGTSAVLKLIQKQNGWITTVIIIGDTSQFGILIWITALVYELSKLVALSMDRGETHERAKIRLYSTIGHVSIAVFLLVQVALAISYMGYSRYAYSMLLAVYALQTGVFVYMIVTVVVLKVNGRSYESIHGRFVTSPLYRRLKWIMLAYAFFAFQFQLSSVILYAAPADKQKLSEFAGVSFTLYYLRGFVFSIVTGCSQLCMVKCMSCCVPEEIKAEYTQRLECMTSPGGYDLPCVNPVFVVTDIESSSALWAIEDGRIMQQATRLHDDILRSLLAAYRGYEVATAGDSFQLAFHTIREAVEYCLTAQMHLLKAKWPKDLHGLIPATRKERVGTKTIFRGLRVRMGVHDAAESDGPLICDVHVVTGKLTYTGASEVITNEIGGLGPGGHILVTERVAEWLVTNSSQMDVKFVMEHVCKYSLPRSNVALEVFQVVPKSLAMRCKSFRSPQHVVQIERETSQTRAECRMFYTSLQLLTYS